MISLIFCVLAYCQYALCYPQSILSHKISPKVVIVSMFQPEEEAWTSKVDFVHSLPIPGLHPQYPYVHCTEDFEICQFTTGEGEINAASSVAFLISNPKFDFSKTYWLLAGIGGGDPRKVTTGSVTFAKYAIQVGLLYQIDSRELALKKYKDWSSGYFGYGTKKPDEYPDSVYGTEVFEVNEKLRDRAMKLSFQNKNRLAIGDDDNINLRRLYSHPASSNPDILACDVLTSDNYFTGDVLNNYFADYAYLISNGTANYCSSAQEENASLESFIRVAKSGLIDYERIVIMRTISNFVAKPENLPVDPVEFFTEYPKGGFQHALDNLYLGGWPFVEDVVNNWDRLYELGEAFKADNYLGDILGTLGNDAKRDFGKDSYKITGL
ncbi:Purine nucleoside permease [Candida viswanathii]|uniref:Purine nucleoside permease n=1 Tax=Candida viswanathii TaxID=5486 RepID=A0A367YKX2_9ASCO|nr:Purine nucleoside permease [Candida viswanathii]